MKRLITSAVLAASLILPLAAHAQDVRDEAPGQVYPAEPVGPEGGDYDVSVDLEGGAPVARSTFEEPLRTYGDWVTVGAYGSVWRPRVPAGWRPYYYGRWEWTTEGWLWVSDEPFGWATYHYGRWAFDRGAGWLWVPGYQWAPAWVSWRYSGDVVGWAPLAPGLSLYVTDFAFVDFWWTFVPTNRFCGTPIYGSAYAPGASRRWYDATRPAPPRPGPRGGYRPDGGRPAPPAWGGPAPRLVEERIGRPLRPARIVPSPGPGAGRARPGEIGVYRPEARPQPGRRFQDERRGPGAPPGALERGRERQLGPARPERPMGRAPAERFEPPVRAPSAPERPARVERPIAPPSPPPAAPAARPQGRGEERGRRDDRGR